MKLLLSGYYGYGNVGDEAVLQALLTGFSGHEVTVLSAAPKLTEEFNRSAKAVYRYDWFKVLKAVRNCDWLVSGGGTLLQNSTSNRSLFYYSLLIISAKLLRKKVAIVAQGFGPIKGAFPLFLAKFALGLADVITLRDQDSYEAVKALIGDQRKIILAGDPTVLLPVPTESEVNNIFGLTNLKKSGRPLLGVALRGIKSDQLLPQLAAAIDKLAKDRGFLPIFLLFHCPDDMAMTAKVISLMKENSEVIFRVCQPNEMLAIISRLDLLIGARLHALIFAAICGVPMLGISYDPKVEAFMKEIDQPYLKIDDQPSEAEIIAKLSQVMDQGKRVNRELLIEKAKRNFTWLAK